MPVGYHIDANNEDQGKRFLWIAPDLSLISQRLKDRNALDNLKCRWSTTWDMIIAHKPECLVLFIPNIDAQTFKAIIHIEELLNANVQLLDDIDLLDNPMYCKYVAPRRTVYLWTKHETAPVVNKDTWVCFNDVDEPAFLNVQLGLIMMEDYMTGMLILSKKLEQTLTPPSLSTRNQQLPKQPELVLVIGKMEADVMTNLHQSIQELFTQDRVGAVISCDASARYMETLSGPNVPFINIADELDRFAIDLLWRQLKSRQNKQNSYVFLGEWTYTESKHASHFAAKEKEVPCSSCVYDTLAWWSLHPGKKLDIMQVRLMMNPATVFKHFLTSNAEKLELTLGTGESDEPEEPNEPHCSCENDDAEALA